MIALALSALGITFSSATAAFFVPRALDIERRFILWTLRDVDPEELARAAALEADPDYFRNLNDQPGEWP